MSLFTTSTRCYVPSPDMVLLKKVGASQCYQGSGVSMFANKSRSQPSLSQSLVLKHKKYPVQVLCSQKKVIPIVEARSMDEIYDTLAERLVPTAASGTSTSVKHIVGLAGPPGAGKTTIASEIVKRVNKIWPQKSCSFDSQVEPPEIAVVLPMDGFHLYRHQLDSMENPKEAHARRGAPWTFNPDLFLKCLKTLREQGSVYAPSFDHGVGDPVEDDVFVNVQHKVVIVEGNYILLEDGTWKEVSSMFDEKWFVDLDIDIAMERVLKRHIGTGNTPELAKQRIEYNDRPNAELVYKSKKNADLIIKSVAL
ncbi:P-loop containing nucleoside triphosphate hydrolases superfamily protein [Artemisia annua]|uniref:P-loop containing nucleoside triphosphate hydrolases superfamily protein n=1 Tax=Artemisia annua TaxID=35608 RepID=A0A2U1MN53_ARTAN|nr:P-loop containing nucleoside triphosphate hydrolases superfamily protein [Artemisia annua]